MLDSDPEWQVGPCVDPWGASECPHYMALHEATMSIDEADAWCSNNTSCYGYTYATNSTGASGERATACYFRDETQIYFMDSEINSLQGSANGGAWTSHVKKARAVPLSPNPSGLQVWIKDLGGQGLALLLINLGNSTLVDYSIAQDKLPLPGGEGSRWAKARDLYAHVEYERMTDEQITFRGIVAHDSVFLRLSE